ncbi:MAG: response regulator [Kiritimatiellae bacterium]|nr:response regulator [Kiritimatiellia bacterium]
MNNQEQKIILLVEDDTVSAMVEAHILDNCGYDVVTAKSGEEAVQVVTHNQKIDLVLMDINLGSGMDGTEAARQILGKRNLPIVFLTAHTEKEYVERVKAITRYGYVVKASDKFVLQSSIEMALKLFDTANKLRESEERHRHISSVISDITYSCCVTGNGGYAIDWIEGAAEAATGYSIDEIKNKRFFKFMVVEEDLALFEKHVSGLAPGQSSSCELRLRHKNGNVVWVTSFAKCLQEPDGQALRLYGGLIDITAHKRAEEKRERLSVAIEQAAEIVVITDTHGVIQYVNPVFETVTGYTREEAVGRKPSILKSGQHDGAFYRELWETIRNGKTWHGRLVNRKKSGALYTEEATISCVRGTGGTIINYVAVKRDITAELNIHAQLVQAQKMESVGHLAGGVAHDFNNILQIILGNVELALARTEENNPLRPDLEEIRDASRRAAELIRQLLGFARKQAIVPRTLDLNETVEGMLKMLRRLIGEDVELVWTPCVKLWPINMDPSQINQILVNLCVNARDGIGGVGAVQIATENVSVDELHAARHDGISPGKYVLLTVSDTGRGIDKDTQGKIFEPFFTTKMVGKGTGLGLATVYGIVQQNHGHISVYSEPGMGATLKIYLPRHTGNETTPAANLPAMPFTLGSGKLLLVEDDSRLLDMCKQMLQQLGYSVLAAGTPKMALRVAKEHVDDIQLLLTDVIMPGMNGRELAGRLKARQPNLKCIFMSGYTADIIAYQGVLDKSDYFIQKPFSMEYLAAKVREALAGP